MSGLRSDVCRLLRVGTSGLHWVSKRLVQTGANILELCVLGRIQVGSDSLKSGEMRLKSLQF